MERWCAMQRGAVPEFRTGLLETVVLAEQLSGLIGQDERHPYGRIMTAFLNHDVGGGVDKTVV